MQEDLRKVKGTRELSGSYAYGDPFGPIYGTRSSGRA